MKKTTPLLQALLVVTTLSFSPSGHARDHILINDSLINGSLGQLFEGVSTKDGYAPTTLSGHVLYRPRYWPEYCTISFEAKGIGGFSGHIDWDPAFLAVYDGRGIHEPAPHGNDFKNNFYRFNVALRTRRNVIQCVINCAKDTEERRNADYPVFAAKSGLERDWMREPYGEPTVDWQQDKWHKFVVKWTPETVTVTIDGLEKWSIELDPSYPYRPVEPRIWLGSAPRGNLGGEHKGREKYANHYPDSLYRNFMMTDNNAKPEN